MVPEVLRSQAMDKARENMIEAFGRDDLEHAVYYERLLSDYEQMSPQEFWDRYYDGEDE